MPARMKAVIDAIGLRIKYYKNTAYLLKLIFIYSTNLGIASFGCPIGLVCYLLKFPIN